MCPGHPDPIPFLGSFPPAEGSPWGSGGPRWPQAMPLSVQNARLALLDFDLRITKLKLGAGRREARDPEPNSRHRIRIRVGSPRRPLTTNSIELKVSGRERRRDVPVPAYPPREFAKGGGQGGGPGQRSCQVPYPWGRFPHRAVARGPHSTEAPGDQLSGGGGEKGSNTPIEVDEDPRPPGPVAPPLGSPPRGPPGIQIIVQDPNELEAIRRREVDITKERARRPSRGSNGPTNAVDSMAKQAPLFLTPPIS